jgi:hypothetical protein
LPVHDARIWIVENKVNLLTLPPSARTIAVGALGRAIVELRSVPWLARLPIFYWGDLDVEGFEILSALRAEFPQARSMFMDATAFANYRHLAVQGTGRKPAIPPHPTPPYPSRAASVFRMRQRQSADRTGENSAQLLPPPRSLNLRATIP